MRKLFNLRLSVFLALALISGIACATFFIIQSYLLFTIFLSGFIISCVIYLIISYKSKIFKKSLIITLILCLFFLVGATLSAVKVNRYNDANLEGHYFDVTGKVDEVVITDYGSALVVSDVKLSGYKTGNSKYKISLYVMGDKDLEMGDVISFNAQIFDKSSSYEGRFSGESVANGLKYTANVNAHDITLIKTEKSVFHKINIIIRDTLKSGMGDKEFPVAYALLVGNSDFIQTETLSNYRSAGVAHIFAVSGLHIGFFAVALGFVLKKLKVPEILRALIVVGVCIFYSGVCGFSASSIRATVTCAVSYFVNISYKKYDALSSLGIATVIVLLINPIWLFCVGFLLSFGVVLGILLLSRPLSKLFRFLPYKLNRSFSAVLGAQISSIPISLAFFGNFSLVAVAFNLILIPVVSVIYIYTLISVLLAGVTGLATAFLFIPRYIFWLINLIINAFDYKFFIVSGITMGGFVFSYYSAIICLSGVINLPKLFKSVTAILLAVITVVGTTCITLAGKNKIKVYVSGFDTFNLAVVSYKGENTIIYNDYNNYLHKSALRKLKDKYGIDKIDNLIVLGDNEDLFYLCDRLNNYFDIGSVYYFGEQDQKVVKLMGVYYPTTKCNFIKENGRICDGRYAVSYLSDGYGASVSFDKFNMLFFGNFGNYHTGYLGEDKEYKLIVASDYAENIFASYFSEIKCTYTNSLYENGQSNGILCLSFSGN